MWQTIGSVLSAGFVVGCAMDDIASLAPPSVSEVRRRRLAAMRLQEIEGNPLSADQVAMFEMFEREAWTSERRLAYILAKAKTPTAE
jgi:hypothetical protein